MKKLILFLTLLFVGLGATFEANAQYSPSNNLNYIKLLKTPPIGSVEDSVMVYDSSSSFVKMLPKSSIVAGYELKSNKQNDLTPDGTGTKYPTVDAVNAVLPTSYSKIVYVNATSPTTATVFDLENPPVTNNNLLKNDTANLYIGTDASTWVYLTGTGYVTKTISSATSNFNTFGTTVDAGNSKTSHITRSGPVTLTGSLNLSVAKISTTPNTSAGSYDILTRNSSTTALEKKLVSDFVQTTTDQSITGKKNFTSNNTVAGGISILNSKTTYSGFSDNFGLTVFNTGNTGIYVENTGSGSTGVALSVVNQSDTNVGLQANNFGSGNLITLRNQGGTGDLLSAELGKVTISSAGKLSTTEVATTGNNVTNKTYVDAKITQTITNGVTDKSPSEDAVFDALTLKANAADSENIENKQNDLTPDGTGTKYPTVDAVNTKVSNIDNTSDANKPVSTATQTALNLKENVANKSDSYTSSSSTTYVSTKALVDGLSTKAPISNSTNYIQNQNASAQSANMWISGSIRNSQLTLGSDSLEEFSSDSDNGVVAVNFNGYNGGTSRFRDFRVFNGKQASILHIIGSTGAATFTSTVTASPATLDTQLATLGQVNGIADYKENAFSKNTAFNKNFGATAGTVAEGNDSRILNGQTAFGWGNHVNGGYAFTTGSNINQASFRTALGLGSNAYTSTDYLPIDSTRSTADFNTLTSSGVYKASGIPLNSPGNFVSLITANNDDTGLQIVGGFYADNLYFRGWNLNGANFSAWRKIWHDGNFNPANYLPLSGGTISGNVNVTGTFNGSSGTFSSKVSTVGYASVIESNGGFNAVSSNVNLDNVSFKIMNSAASKVYAFTAGTQGVSHDGFGLWNVTDNTHPVWVEPSGDVSLNANTTVSGKVTASPATLDTQLATLGQVKGIADLKAPIASPTFTGIPTAPTAPVGTNTTQIATMEALQAIRPYKVYTALLSQAGTNAPVATVLENTLGGTVVWSYSSTGIYIGTLSGAFTVNKTLTLMNTGYNVNGFEGINRVDVNSVQIQTYLNGPAYADGRLANSGASIEIRVYN